MGAPRPPLCRRLRPCESSVSWFSDRPWSDASAFLPNNQGTLSGWASRVQGQHRVFPSFSGISRRSALPGAEGSPGRAWPLRTSKASGFIFQMLLLRLCCLLFFLFVLHLLRLLALKFLPVKGHSSLCFPTSSPLTKPQSGMCGGPRPQGRLAAGEGSGPAQASPVTPVLLASAHGHLTGLWPAGLVLVTYPWILHGCESYSYSVQGQGNLRGV